jgi:hypothetical protein
MALFLGRARSKMGLEFHLTPSPRKETRMPIQVTCQCGYSLNAPDSMAGKSGKCPKCQQMIKVPGAASSPAKGAAAASATGTKSPAGPKKAEPPMAAVAPSALDGLLESAGLTQRQGKYCPACDAPVQAGAVLCIKCGFNFAEGTKLEAHKTVSTKRFGNKQLNEAIDMMARESDTEARLLKAGSPWWFLFAFLTGVVVLILGALIKMDANTTGEISSNPTIAKIQRAHILTVMAASAGLGCLLISNIAQLAILFTAFKESWKQGLLCMFAPFYILYYMFSRIRTYRLGSTITILFVSAILAGILMGYSFPKI